MFIKKLRKAQKAWLEFRDAHFDALFPHASEGDPKEIYGSVFPMCRYDILADLTRTRVAELRIWLDKVEEGDVCAGSHRHS